MTDVSFRGIANEVMTFKSEGAKAGYPVNMSASKTVKCASSQEEFIGIAVNVRGNHAGVQTHGYVEMIYSGETPKLGYGHLVASGSGYVMKATSSTRAYKIITVKPSTSTVGFIL